MFRMLVHASVGVLLFGAVQSVSATTIDFEGLNDGDAVTTQFAAQGVIMSNSTVLTAGASLNEFEFPPASGINVAVDDGGPLTLTFSVPIQFSGWLFHLSRADHPVRVRCEWESARECNLGVFLEFGIERESRVQS